MRHHRHAPALVAVLALVACKQGRPGSPPPPRPERHLAEVRQLTFGGENAEAYWSFDDRQLIFQTRPALQGCDRIERMTLDATPPARAVVSDGKGATTCSYFLPGDAEVIFASTEGGGPTCPPRPDHSQGYVWAIYDSYDIYRARADGSGLRRLTDTPGYDAEGTVCAKDGSIVFTSVRDGDLELYRMDAGGQNVRRLTSYPGYDGGAFFNTDCTKLVWRASRPRSQAELDEYRALLARGLVRPTKLELWVANADGSEPMQVTYLDAASFAPYWFPSSRRIIFSSNYGDPKGREFDLWAVNTDGTQLERITTTPGFDGFPMFSFDGTRLAFSSNRATAPGARDTNVFVARWVEGEPGERVSLPADQVMADVTWLAAPAREGRGPGSTGLLDAGAFVEGRLKDLGLTPAGDEGGYRQAFGLPTSVEIGPATLLAFDGKVAPRDGFTPLAFSSSGTAEGTVVAAGYGIVAPELGIDDYAGVDARGKVVFVRRFTPETPALSAPELKRRHGDLRQKAWLARERGAAAVVVVDEPLSAAGGKPFDEAPLPPPRLEGFGDAGIPVVVATRAAATPLLAGLARGRRVRARVVVQLERIDSPAFNVVARLPAGAPADERLPGVVVLGAHYDHLGLGGPESLAPDSHEPHLGADDNASGTAGILEAARLLAQRAGSLRRDVLVVGFSGEEEGALGSTWFTRHPTAVGDMKDVVAMVNLDMVGRLRRNTLSVIGAESATEWPDVIAAACRDARLECTATGGGYGPSDQTPFYAAGVPVLHFFTGAHADYHKPSDAAAAINGAGLAQIAVAAADIVTAVASRPERLTYQSVPSPAPRGDLRSYNASLGTVPDYAGPPKGQPGMLVAGVRPGGAAEAAGVQRGDILIRVGEHEIRSVEDLAFVLRAQKPGDRVTLVLLREGKEVRVEAVLQERPGR